MGRLLFVSSALFAVACTKANPEATCAMGGKCTNPGLPICDADGALSGLPGTCLAPCVPGTVGACAGSDAAYVCNSSADGYTTMSCPFGCDSSAKICTVTCTTNSQCSSGICKSDGACADEAEIVHVAPNGSPASDCSKSSPCTLDHAASLQTSGSGQYVDVAPGDYALGASLTLNGKRTIVGTSAAQTTIRNSGTGATFVIGASADITIDSLTLADAKGTPPNKTDGTAIACPDTPIGMRTLHVVDSVFTNNGDGAGNAGAIIGGPCTVDVRRSVFDGNYSGMNMSGDVTVDRCSFTSNLQFGLYVSGNFNITNVLAVRNGLGMFVEGPTSTPTFEFNTIADNMQGLDCEHFSTGVSFTASNNIIARNQMNVVTLGGGTPCTVTNSIVTTDASSLQFLHADSVPYDYHLGAGSIAIDAAQGSSSLNHDYDGDIRPKGAAADVGADEAF